VDTKNAKRKGTGMNRKTGWIILGIVLCMAVFLAACSKIEPEIQTPSSSPSEMPSASASKPPEATPDFSATPSPTPDVLLKSGVESEKVYELQQRLGELGYLKIEEYTEKYGPATERAVRLFQRQNGLEEDGIAG
jgi:peptidoglycan hydrolase-like protein with peptidoglycan-binding domain